MRTIQQIEANTSAISQLMKGLKEQIAILNHTDEYQGLHIERYGSRNEYFDEIETSLSDAWHKLNGLLHMEHEAILDLKYPEDEEISLSSK